MLHPSSGAEKWLRAILSNILNRELKGETIISTLSMNLTIFG